MKRILLIICCYTSQFLHAQKSFTIEECESLFLKNNFLLLASQYSIDASKAAVIQAGIWEQPYFTAELNAVNPEAGRVFDIGGQGQKAFTVQQLIYLGGKKKNEVAFAKSNVAIAQLEFEQLVRQLRYQMNVSFYTLYYELNKTTGITDQLANVDRLADAYAVQVQKGNIPLKDLVRLQSLSLDIKNELTGIRQRVHEEQAILKILTGTDTLVLPVLNIDSIEHRLLSEISYKLPDLEIKTLENNPEYLTAKKLEENSALMLQWQKSLSVPDLTVGSSYDQRGGAFNNQVNLNLGISLPFWNRNRGNIRMAQSQILQQTSLKDQKGRELKTQVENAYRNLMFQQEQFRKLGPDVIPNAELVYRGILQNFQKQNISLIEFTDFMESYTKNILLVNEMKKQIISSAEELNLLVNEKIF